MTPPMFLVQLLQWVPQGAKPAPPYRTAVSRLPCKSGSAEYRVNEAAALISRIGYLMFPVVHRRQAWSVAGQGQV
jgi:hypothetical protein